MDHKKPQKDKALTQAFPLTVVVDNPPRSITPAITNAISLSVKLDEFAGNVAVTNADRISSVIIYQSFSQPGTAMPNYPTSFNVKKTTVKPTNAVPSAF